MIKLIPSVGRGERVICSFPPIVAGDAQVLILGSIPGVLSLQKQQYYAHPRNSFWAIMAALFGVGPALEYQQRTARLKSAKVALWDVLQTCEREGSLDSAIQTHTVVVNRFLEFFQQSPDIHHVFFNGQKAGLFYSKHTLPLVKAEFPHIQYLQLPSTSPAHAALSFEQKLSAWAVVRDSIPAMNLEKSVESWQSTQSIDAPG